MHDFFPSLVRVRQKLNVVTEPEVRQGVRRELSRLGLATRVRPGETIALAAGSRGIAHIDEILAETVAYVRSLGLEPFIFPAMGSHGGGTAAGQVDVLKQYGVTEERVGAPIKASMEVVELARHELGGPVYLDRIASQADHIGIVARVKPHTTFAGRLESGLCKMMMIGLGKHVGALRYHQDLVRQPWEPYLRAVSKSLLATGKILFGMGIVENPFDETGRIESTLADGIIELDERLLKLAYTWLPKLPFTDADVLIIDEIGKDVSGAGLDPNVFGRKEDTLLPSNGKGVRRIVVRDLTEKTKGNATGIGYADFTTSRVVKKMDYPTTVTNCLTANRPEGAAIPVHFESDKEVIQAALRSVGLESPANAKLQWIRNTLLVEELLVSTNYVLSESQAPLEVIGREEMEFTSDGRCVNVPNQI